MHRGGRADPGAGGGGDRAGLPGLRPGGTSDVGRRVRGPQDAVPRHPPLPAAAWRPPAVPASPRSAGTRPAPRSSRSGPAGVASDRDVSCSSRRKRLNTVLRWQYSRLAARPADPSQASQTSSVSRSTARSAGLQLQQGAEDVRDQPGRQFRLAHHQCRRHPFVQAHDLCASGRAGAQRQSPPGAGPGPVPPAPVRRADPARPPAAPLRRLRQPRRAPGRPPAAPHPPRAPPASARRTAYPAPRNGRWNGSRAPPVRPEHHHRVAPLLRQVQTRRRARGQPRRLLALEQRVQQRLQLLVAYAAAAPCSVARYASDAIAACASIADHTMGRRCISTAAAPVP